MTVQQMVKQFHKAFGVPIGTEPAIDPRCSWLRAALVSEESAEFITALAADDIVKTADALGDIVYVTYGSALSFGINLDVVVKEIHLSNMSKLGPDGKPIRRADGKIRKGPSYRPPDIAGVLGIKPA